MRNDTHKDCPSGWCPMCNGEACNKCGAGCWNNNAPLCEHDVIERHEGHVPPVTPEANDAQK